MEVTCVNGLGVKMMKPKISFADCENNSAIQYVGPPVSPFFPLSQAVAAPVPVFTVSRN
jgi:hypothetical protein